MPNDNFTLKYQDRQVTVTKNGGTVLSFKNKNKEILYQGSSSKRSGIPILFPFANPLKDDIFLASGHKLSQHGFARNSVFKINQISDSILELVLNYKNIPEEMQLAYPFKFELKIVLDISQENTLIYKLLVTNLDKQNLPIAPGIHPYFFIKQLDKKALKISNLDLQNIDWEQPSNGYFYDFSGEVTVNLDLNNTVIIKETGHNTDFKNLVIWSQISQGNADYDFVCIEPFTRKTNAINDNPIIVMPGEMWAVQLEFVV
jgi:galactose mutarotase-like enzyme